MKRIFSIFCCLTLTLCLCACKEGEENNLSSVLSSSNTESSLVTTLVSEASSSSIVTSSDVSSSEQVITSSKQVVTSAEQSVSSMVNSTEQEPEITSSSEQNGTQTSTSLSVFSYTVNDPNNLRGLSTEKRGYSFGIAKDGKPHSQSVINQNTFDSFENVKALALDTKTAEKVMYLTFDNGYEYQNLTADILDTLKEKGVKAAFFITMSYAKSNKALVQRMIDEGHIVGNHSTTHPSFPNLTRAKMAEEIALLDNYLRENFGYTSPYFRFPAGEYSECALELVSSIGFRSVFWSVAYSDWDTSAQKGTDFAYSTVTSRFHPGAVILLHAVSKDNAEALGSIIDAATDQGYTFKTLDAYFG